MEHILQFAIDIDDERIRQIAEDRVAQQVINEVRKRANSGGGWTDPNLLDRLFQEEIKNVVDERKDEIIEKAVEKAVAGVTRSKKFIELMAVKGEQK